jgi:hypothetical protein
VPSPARGKRVVGKHQQHIASPQRDLAELTADVAVRPVNRHDCSVIARSKAQANVPVTTLYRMAGDASLDLHQQHNSMRNADRRRMTIDPLLVARMLRDAGRACEPGGCDREVVGFASPVRVNRWNPRR